MDRLVRRRGHEETPFWRNARTGRGWGEASRSPQRPRGAAHRSQVERFGRPQREELLDELWHVPVSRQATRKVSDIASLQSVRRSSLLADRHLPFEDADELVPREDPLEFTGRAAPEAG